MVVATHSSGGGGNGAALKLTRHAAAEAQHYKVTEERRRHGGGRHRRGSCRWITKWSADFGHDDLTASVAAGGGSATTKTIARGNEYNASGAVMLRSFGGSVQLALRGSVANGGGAAPSAAEATKVNLGGGAMVKLAPVATAISLEVANVTAAVPRVALGMASLTKAGTYTARISDGTNGTVGEFAAFNFTAPETGSPFCVAGVARALLERASHRGVDAGIARRLGLRRRRSAWSAPLGFGVKVATRAWGAHTRGSIGARGW